MLLKEFREIWLCDFEFIANPGERPEPVCLVARELRSNRIVRLWRDEFGSGPPIRPGPIHCSSRISLPLSSGVI